jgi:hypothetical protein
VTAAEATKQPLVGHARTVFSGSRLVTVFRRPEGRREGRKNDTLPLPTYIIGIHIVPEIEFSTC